MDTNFLEEIKNEIQKGITDKNHPFKFCAMATNSNGNEPKLRTVVLREFKEDMLLSIFTDKRSKKVIQIKNDNKVSLLLFHPEKLVQVFIEGTATIVEDETILKKYWSNTPEHARKDYTTEIAPGSTITNPDTLEYLNAENHFCIINIQSERIEYLKLSRPSHIRVQFTKTNNQWEHQFLAP